MKEKKPLYLERMKKLRQERKLSQEDVATKINTTPQNYGKYENGVFQISVDMLLQVARVLEVEVTEILGLDNPEPKEDTTAEIYVKLKVTKAQMKKMGLTQMLEQHLRTQD